MLYESLQQACRNEGYTHFGGYDLDHPAALATYRDHLRSYETWISERYQGKMTYLERGISRRQNLEELLPSVKSVFCVLDPYPAAKVEGLKTRARFSRYLEGRDYHESIKEKLERVAKNSGAVHYKICVDTSAVLERTLAYLCGLGWFGKNTMLMNKELGSFFFIGVLLLGEKLNQHPVMQKNLCGHCERCLTGCPTRAFVKPQLLDARKCISYLTLEERGSPALADSQLEERGSWVAGCDVCQEVCPFNHKTLINASVTQKSAFSITKDESQNWVELFSLTSQQYGKFIEGKALNRIKFEDFIRNVALSLTSLELSGELDAETRKQIQAQIHSKALGPGERVLFWRELSKLWEKPTQISENSKT